MLCLPVVPVAIVAGFISSVLMLWIWQGGIHK